MPQPKLSKLEFKIMETLWAKNECSIRDIQESFPAKKRPAYTTIQTTVYRMEAKGIVHRLKKVGKFPYFFAGDLARCRTAASNGRSSGSLRRTRATCNDPSH